MKIYWYDIIDDYVFKFDDGKYWALCDSGRIWYRQMKTPRFELMGEL